MEQASSGKKRKAKSKSNKSVKNQLRSLRRMLGRLEGDAKQHCEKQIVELTERLGDAKRQKKEKETVVRYRKVKFFEKKKANRAIHQLRQKLKKAPTKEKEEIRAKLKAWEADLEYITYFPKSKK